MSFRKKILISYLSVFIILTIATFPLISHIVDAIAIKTMEDRAKELIEKIRAAPNEQKLIQQLKDQKFQIFFRVSIINNDRKVLYDSYTKRLLGLRFNQEYIVDHPEVMDAFDKGSGSSEEYSNILKQRFYYFAQAFDFHGKTYILRTAFPYQYFSELAQDIEIAFICLIAAVLLIFSIMTVFIIHHFTSPIQQILRAVTPYQENDIKTVPEIYLKPADRNDEFSKLAQTLNSLSARILKQINRLTDERNEKAAILESLVEGVIAVDTEMTVIYANSTALQLLHLQKNELIGKNFQIAQQPKGYEMLVRCQQEKKELINTLTITSDGSTAFLDVIAAPKGESGGAILVMQDKSPHYRLLEMRREFIANASHELKTPITIIRGFAEMLHDHPELSQEVTADVTGKIVKNCQRMATLIKDLLILSDVDNIPLSRLSTCDIEEIIRGCYQTVHEMYPEAQISITTPQQQKIELTADASLLELAMMNLIENAAKYSTPPATIDISIEKIHDNIRIIIADKGIGIPKGDLEHIFERFYTVNKAHSQKLGGSGLGLSIVQTIIHKHLGKIHVTSEMGKGTAFTITLPCSAIAMDAMEP